MPSKKTSKNTAEKSAAKKKKSEVAKAPAIKLEPKKPSRKQRLQNRRQQAKTTRATYKPLSSGFRLLRDTTSFVRQYWKLYLGLTIVYLVLSFILVGGLGGGYDIRTLREDFVKQSGELGASLSIFGLLLGSAGKNVNEGGMAYQTIIVLVVSLATIWMVRQLMAGKALRLRDPFYKGMYPLIPFALVITIVCVQIIPAIFGGFVFTSVTANREAIAVWEYALWICAALALVGVSFYALSASLFALFIVTLPDVAPMTALRSAKKMVKFRRGLVLRKLLFLPVVVLLLGLLILLPAISLLPGLVVPLFVALSMFVLPFGLTYGYMLYRELL